MNFNMCSKPTRDFFEAVKIRSLLNILPVNNAAENLEKKFIKMITNMLIS